MKLEEALKFDLPRRRANVAEWERPDDCLLYTVWDVLALDWEVQFPNGRIIEDFCYALHYESTYCEATKPNFKILEGGNNGSSSPA